MTDKFPVLVIAPTLREVKVPTLVIFGCAAVDKVPTKAVDVILVAPVTTPASTLIVPSKIIGEPVAGVIFKLPVAFVMKE